MVSPTIQKRSIASSSRNNSDSNLQGTFIRASRSGSAAGSRSGSATGTRAALIGRQISVPYHLLIDDDSSGCTCESIIIDGASRGFLVILAGEKVWKTETFIRRWLCPSSAEQATDDLADELLATCTLGSLAPSTGMLSRATTALEGLEGLDAGMKS